jgi:hypothetical protein
MQDGGDRRAVAAVNRKEPTVSFRGPGMGRRGLMGLMAALINNGLKVV